MLGGDVSLTSQEIRKLAKQTTVNLHKIINNTNNNYNNTRVLRVTDIQVDTSIFRPDKDNKDINVMNTFNSIDSDSSWEVMDINSSYGATVDAFMADRANAILMCSINNNNNNDNDNNNGNDTSESNTANREVSCQWDFESDATRAIVLPISYNNDDNDNSTPTLEASYSRLLGSYVISPSMNINYKNNNNNNANSIVHKNFTLPVFNAVVHAKAIFRKELQAALSHNSSNNNNNYTDKDSSGDPHVILPSHDNHYNRNNINRNNNTSISDDGDWISVASVTSAPLFWLVKYMNRYRYENNNSNDNKIISVFGQL